MYLSFSEREGWCARKHVPKGGPPLESSRASQASLSLLEIVHALFLDAPRREYLNTQRNNRSVVNIILYVRAGGIIRRLARSTEPRSEATSIKIPESEIILSC